MTQKKGGLVRVWGKTAKGKGDYGRKSTERLSLMVEADLPTSEKIPVAAKEEKHAKGGRDGRKA